MSSACLGVLVAQSVRLHSGVPADDRPHSYRSQLRSVLCSDVNKQPDSSKNHHVRDKSCMSAGCCYKRPSPSNGKHKSCPLERLNQFMGESGLSMRSQRYSKIEDEQESLRVAAFFLRFLCRWVVRPHHHNFCSAAACDALRHRGPCCLRTGIVPCSSDVLHLLCNPPCTPFFLDHCL